jgi:hypothetical protein
MFKQNAYLEVIHCKDTSLITGFVINKKPSLTTEFVINKKLRRLIANEKVLAETQQWKNK